MRDNMAVEDAINVVHVLGCELASDGSEDIRKLASAANSLVSHVQELAAELERERARRQWIGHREAMTLEGHRLVVEGLAHCSHVARHFWQPNHPQGRCRRARERDR